MKFLVSSNVFTYIFYFLYSWLGRPQASDTLKAGHRQTSQTHGDERRLEALGWILWQINSHKLTVHYSDTFTYLAHPLTLR